MDSWACRSCDGRNPEGTGFCGHCGTARRRGESDVGASVRRLVRSHLPDSVVDATGSPVEQRRFVTAIFADITGFTPLTERLDAETMTEVIDLAISAMSLAVERYEGYVDKYAGDALLAFFGAPVAHADDAVRAVQAALDMHDALERLLPQLPPEAGELALHIGVNSGPAVARIIGGASRADYSVFGDAVNTAQRLEGAAPTGQTYVGQSTFELARDRFAFDFVGELTLKGKSRPVPAWRVARRHRAPVSPPLGGQLVGRAEELRTLTERVDRALRGDGGVLVVRGEAGIGKTALLAATRRYARANAVRWLDARFDAIGPESPYAPFAALISQGLGLPLDDPTRARSRLHETLRKWDQDAAVPYVEDLLGIGDDVTPQLDQDAFRRHLHLHVSEVLGHLTDDGPCIIAIEDLHVADRSSSSLLQSLAADAADRRMLLVVTERDAESRSDAPRFVDVETVSLGPVTHADVGEIARIRLGAPPAPELVDRLVDRTAGNPLFVTELTAHLSDIDAVIRTTDGWNLRPGFHETDAIPPTVESVIAARLDRLDRPVVEVLHLAAVFGTEMSVKLLEAASDGEAGDVRGAVDALVQAGFLESVVAAGVETVAFRHALLHEVTLGRLLRRHRRGLHLRAADALERLHGWGDDTIEQLAHHLSSGDAGPRAVDALVAAARRARRLFANDDAIRHLLRAEEVADPLGIAVEDIRLMRAQLCDLIGDYETAAALFATLVETTGLPAARGLSAAHRKQGRYGEARQAIDLAVLGPGDATGQVELERGRIHLAAGEVVHALHAFERGLADTGDDTALEAELLLHAARCQAELDRLDDALARATEAHQRFSDADDRLGLLTATRVLGGIYDDLGRHDEAADTLRSGLELAEEVGSVEELGGCLVNLGLVEQSRNHLADAIACDRRAIDVLASVGHPGHVGARANLSHKLLSAARLDEALAEAVEAQSAAEAIGDQMSSGDAMRTRAEVLLGMGRDGDAGAAAESAAGVFESIGLEDEAASSWEIAAEAWSRCGESVRSSAARARASALSGT